MGCCGKKTGDGDQDIEMKEKGKWGKAKEFDPSFNGPIKNRSCTDIPCCILFVLYVIGMLALGGAAFYMGNPYKLLNSVDSFGNICGYTAGFEDRPKLVFFDMTVCISPASFATDLFAYSCPTTQVCRKKCPEVNALGSSLSGDDMVCRYDVKTAGLTTLEKLDFISKKKCAPYVLKSTDVMNRCVPTILSNQLGNLFPTDTNNVTGTNITGEAVQQGSLYVQTLLKLQNLGLKVIADVQDSWYWILGALGIAMVASFIYILIMRWVAGLLVWLTTYAVLTLVGFGVYYSWTQYTLLRDNANATSSVDIVVFGLDQYTNNQQTWYYLTIILGVILGILVLLLLALRKRIQIAIALIKESSRAITNMVFSLFFPIIPWLMQLILFGWFVAVLAFLVTSGQPNYSAVDSNGTVKSPCDYTDAMSKKFGVLDNDTTCKFINFNDNDHIFRMQVYHLFGWFWIMNFIIALGQCVLAGAFASYYWAYDKKNDVPTFPVAASFYRTLRYHTGSLAFGSLIIAIVQLIRAGLEYLDHKLNGTPGTQGEIAKYIMKCLKCCFWCLEKFLKFLNKNAYIEIAVYGKNFCVSAKNAFFLLMRNILRVVVLDKVTDFILFIGQLSITFGVGVGSFYWFKRQSNLNYYLAPVFIIVIGSYVISSAFFSVYNMAIDTVFLCFLEDLERNDGSEQKPYYMSKSLKKILGKKNKKESDDD